MASVNIVTYVTIDKNKGQSVKNPPEVSNVPMPDNKHVGVGLTCFFGFRHTMKELSKVRMANNKPGVEVYTIELSSGVKKPIPITMDLENLKKHEVLNLSRLSSGLHDLVMNYFDQFMASDERGKKAFRVSCPDVETAITKFPELLADLHDQPEFSHMDMFIYRIGEGEQVTRATLFSYKNINRAEYKNAPEGMPLYLPDLQGEKGHEVIARLKKRNAA